MIDRYPGQAIAEIAPIEINKARAIGKIALPEQGVYFLAKDSDQLHIPPPIAPISAREIEE